MFAMKFTKTQGRPRLLQDSKIRDDSTREEDEEKDFVTSVDRAQIHGTKKKEVKKELIIPLIAKNEWRASSPGNDGGRDNEKKDVEKPQVSLEDQAIQELLGQGLVPDKEEEEDDNVPLLLQNKVPKGFEEDDNMDVSLRPDVSSLDDYERIPIEEFGMAMLRGMGWSKDVGIGLKNKQHVEMLEPQLRPKGLGLGASISTQAKQEVQNSHQKEEENLVFKIGAGAVIQRGAEKGMYGRIEAFDEDNNRVVVKLAISGKMCTVSKFHILLVKESEYKTKSKVLNYDQYAEFKEKQDAKEKDRKRDNDERVSDRNDSKRLKYDEREDRKGRERKSKNEDGYKDYKNGHSSSKSSSKSNPTRNWVRPHLKVRFIDKKYKNGKHYKEKFIVEDVVELDRFTLRSESYSTLLEDIKSSQVETVIPKDIRSAVSVLTGRHKGRVGELVERIRDVETAVVKIPDAGVIELSYDDICEFVGDPEDFY